MPVPKRMNAPRRANALSAATMFPHTVTVYNTAISYDEDSNETVTNHITVLRGVFLDVSKAVSVRDRGLEGADAVNLYIPFGVDAVDGVTGRRRQFLPPVEFWRQEDRDGFWTICAGSGKRDGSDSAAFFVKGEVVEPELDRNALEKAYDNVFSVTKVDDKDFGGLAHWEVGGA